MLQQTRGLVIRTVKYAETSLIARIYTEKLGLQSYIINSVRTANPTNKMVWLQPLTLLDMVVYHRKGKDLQRIKEMRPEYIFISIPFDTPRRLLALFIAEVLYKTLKEEEANTPQFEFLYEAVSYLDQSQQSVANFHLVFLLQLSRYLGFFPQNNFSTALNYFDLREGVFTTQLPFHTDYAAPPLTDWLSQLIGLSLTQSHSLRLNRTSRKQLLQTLLRYYALHIEGFGELRSPDILEEVLGE